MSINEALEVILQQMNLPSKQYNKNDIIYYIDDKADKVYCIIEGRIKLFNVIDDTGKEINVRIYRKGDWFGESALSNSENRKEAAVALEKVTTYVIPLTQMNSMLENQNFGQYMLEKIAIKNAFDSQKLISLVHYDSRSRIILFLIESIENEGQRVGYEWVVRNMFTHQDLANITFTSRQTVTTVLNELRSKDILTFNRKRLLVRNLDLLKNEIQHE